MTNNEFEAVINEVNSNDVLGLPDLITDENGAPIFKSIDEAVKRYVDQRDSLKLYMNTVNKVEAQAKAELSKISMWLRDKGDELGIDSFKTQYGTAYRSVKVSYRVGDWNTFINWVKQNDAFQCLEKRVAKLAVKEIHDAEGEVPKGVDYFCEVEFDVRRPIKAKK